MPRDQIAADELASQNLAGVDARCARSEASLRRVRRSVAISETVATIGRARWSRWADGTDKPEPTRSANPVLFVNVEMRSLPNLRDNGRGSRVRRSPSRILGA